MQINDTQVKIDTAAKPKADSGDQEPDSGNPVWEEMSPLVWRDSIYSEEAKESIMGKLFVEEIKLFQ